MENFPLPMTLRIDSASQTDQGMKRPNNEDWVAGFEPNDPAEVEYSGYLYIVADGVGGASKGERASQYAAQKVLYEYYQHPSIPPGERLATLIRKAGNEIFEYAAENGSPRMATTMVAAVIRGDRLTVANVGDSRAYLIRGGTVTQISQDHNLANELVRNGTMTATEAKRSKTRNKLMRSLGGETNVDVDIFRDIQLIPGDLILLCSDGLTRYATDEDLQRLSGEGSPEEIGKAMIAFANQAGGADNITLYVIEVRTSSAETQRIFKGHAPEPIDWDTIQTQSETPTVRIRRQEKFTSRQVYILAGLIGLLAVVIVVGSLVISGLAKKTPLSPQVTALPATDTLQPTLIISSPTVETVVETNSAQPVDDQGILPTATVSTSPSLEIEQVCVYEIQGGDSILVIYGKYDLQPANAGTPDYQFERCDKDSNQCFGTKVDIPDRDTISMGNFLLIPGVEKDTCEGVENSYWVTVVP